MTTAADGAAAASPATDDRPRWARSLVFGAAAYGVGIGPGWAWALLAIAGAGPRRHLVVLPVGGADVPIVISLDECSFTGLAVAASGLRARPTSVLLVGGTLVGASRHHPHPAEWRQAMGRSMLRDPVRRATVADRPRARLRCQQGPGTGASRSGSPEDVAILLGYAGSVVDRARATVWPSRRPNTRWPGAGGHVLEGKRRSK